MTQKAEFFLRFNLNKSVLGDKQYLPVADDRIQPMGSGSFLISHKRNESVAALPSFSGYA
jgi:hypothetical protein